MPINAGYEYGEAQKRVTDAKTPEEKIKALENLLSVSPNHKGTEKLRLEIKTKISKLKEKAEKEKSKKGSSFSLSIKKEGAAQVTLVGLSNSGKSTILNRFTNAKPQIADYNYTTQLPEIGVLDYNGVNLQIVEIPPIFEGFSYSDKGPSFFAIVRSSDLVCIVLDGTKDCQADLKLIETEFERSSIKLKKIKSTDGLNCIVVVNKILSNFKCEYPVCWIDDFKDAIWRRLSMISVFTKQPGREKEWPPVALKGGSNVKNLADIVHKDFVKNFKYARIWGKSVKHHGMTVGVDHILKEGDIVEFHTK